MNPSSPRPQKQTLWQKLFSLPLKAKLAGGSIFILLVSSVIVIWYINLPKAPIKNNDTPSSSQQNTNSNKEPITTAPEEEAAEQAQPPTTHTPTQAVPHPSPSPPHSPSPTPTPSMPIPPTAPPSGNVRPNSSNTGPNAALTSTYSGAASNGSSGQTFQNMNFPAPGGIGYYIFSGDNLIFRNCYINGGGILISGDNIVIENCTIEGGISLSGTNGVTFRYNNVQNFSGDGIHLTSDSGQAANVTIAHSYIHAPQPLCGDHADGIQIRGVNTLSLIDNVFDMGPWFQVCGQDALNAAIFFESANGGNSNLTVDGNYLNGAGITLRLNPGANQKIINNRFGRLYHYGLVNNAAGPSDIVQKSGNVMDDDGSAVTF